MNCQVKMAIVSPDYEEDSFTFLLTAYKIRRKNRLLDGRHLRSKLSPHHTLAAKATFCCQQSID